MKNCIFLLFGSRLVGIFLSVNDGTRDPSDFTELHLSQCPGELGLESGISFIKI